MGIGLRVHATPAVDTRCQTVYGGETALSMRRMAAEKPLFLVVPVLCPLHVKTSRSKYNETQRDKRA